MAFEYEALVGHLYVVGGRSISAAPPGALVEVAPRKAARGREADTFFTLVLPSGDSIAPTMFYEQMAQLAAERYFNSSGSVTSGLRDVFHTLNQNLVEHNASGKRAYEANMLCAVLRGADLIVGRIGPAVMLLRHEGNLRTFPEDLTEDEALYTPPLGVQAIPNVRMTQFRVAAGTRFVMGDANIADFDGQKLSDALVTSDVTGTLLAFKDLAKLQLTLTAVEFVLPELPVLESVLVGESTAQFTASGKTKTSTRETAVVAEAAPDGAPPSSIGTITDVPATLPEKPKRTPREQKTMNEMQRRASRSMGSSALVFSRFLAGINRLIDKFFPPPKEGQRGWLSSPTAAGLVLLVPVGVVMMVIVMWLSGTGQSEFEMCLDETLRRADLARGIPSSERQTVISAWDQTLTQVESCRNLRPDDPTLLGIRAEGRSTIDGLSQITRREVYAIDSFGPGTALSQIVIQGSDLYVLATEPQSQVYQVQLTSDGEQRATVGQAIPSMRTDASVNGYPVGEIFDIAYSTEDNLILALDKTGVLVTCSPRFLQCAAQELIGSENWVNPVAIATWSGRLYVLDSGVGEIWRYEQSGDGSYASAPSEYFGGQGRLPGGIAVDFDIEDSGGNVYVLLSEGILRKYNSGQQQELALVGFPVGQEIQSADAMYLDDSPIANVIYLISQQRAAIYEVTRGGTFVATYRPSDESMFALIRAVVAAPGQDMVYAVSGNAILAFKKGE